MTSHAICHYVTSFAILDNHSEIDCMVSNYACPNVRIHPLCENCLDYAVRRYVGCVDVYNECRPLYARDRWVCDGPLGYLMYNERRPLYARDRWVCDGPLGYLVYNARRPLYARDRWVCDVVH